MDYSCMSASFEGVFSKVFQISGFGEEDESWMGIEGWMEIVVFFVRILYLANQRKVYFLRF